MDKLKENLFAYANAGLGLLFVALAFFLIWRPLGDIGKRPLTRAQGRLDAKLKLKGELPRPAYVEYRREQARIDGEALAAAESLYQEKHQRFVSYWGARETPNPSTFYGRYDDTIKGLKASYRQKFGLPEPGPENEKPPPVVETVEQSAISLETIEEANKKLKVIQAIFAACEKLGLGGLERIDFPRTRRATEDTQGDPSSRYDYSFLVAEVGIKMRFGEIEAFLAELAANEDVPFMEPLLVQVTKDQEALPQFQKIVQVVKFPSEPQAAEKPYGEIVPEPPARVLLRLRALEWKGKKPPPATEAKTERK